MRILVLAGSPKGEISVTMQYVRYLENEFKDDSFIIHHIVPKAKQLEKDRGQYDALVEDMAASDLILWSFPLYIFVVHSEYLHFIQLLYERDAKEKLIGKTAGVLTTSIHFHDDKAVALMRGVCEDLGMFIADYHTPFMNDLLKEKEQQSLILFFKGLKEAVNSRAMYLPVNPPLMGKSSAYTAKELGLSLNAMGKVVILTDTLEGNTKAMIDTFCSAFAEKPDLFTIEDMGMKGYCMGCLKCGPKNICSYGDKDGFMDFFKKHLEPADLVIIAGELKGRYLSYKWKQFYDRCFFQTHHVQGLWGKYFGFLFSGEYSRMPVLQDFIKCYYEQMRCTVVGVVSDESGDPDLITASIRTLTQDMLRASQWKYQRTPSFAGISGLKLFRDEIYASLRIVFKADHRVYRKNGVYDFPHRHPIKLLTTILMDMITSIPFIQKAMFKNFGQFMIKPYQPVLRQVTKKED